MRLDICKRQPHALVKPHRRREIRHQPFQLRIVKDNAVCLVPQQSATKIPRSRACRSDKRTGDIAGLPLHVKRLCHNGIDLIPGQRLVARDLHRLADGMDIAHKSDKGFGKIRIKSQRPERSPVAVHDHLLSFQHPPDHLIAALRPMHA